MNVSVPATQVKSFPESEICNRMKQFWKEKKDEASDNPFAPERKNTLFDVLPDLDSLEIVTFMLRIRRDH